MSLRRLAAATTVLVVAAPLAASAEAAASSPTAQAQQLAAAQQTFAAAQAAVVEKLGREEAQTNVATDCGGAGRALPKSKQAMAFTLLLSYAVVSGAEALAPAYVAQDHAVAALGLTDPTLSRYGAALHKVATLIAPLQSAKPVDVCTVIGHWEQSGYPMTGEKYLRAIFGLNTAQANATQVADNSNPVVKSFTAAKTAADARMRALGVTPVSFQSS